jgi:Uma2 family endonuclease
MELIYGALRVAESPTVRHQQAVGAFHLALAPHASQKRLGTVFVAPLDVILDWERALVVQPDLLFVSNGRRRIIKDKIVGAPDMVLEVLSPNPRIGKLAERIDWFVEYGVREVWLLHQMDERLDILTAAEGRLLDERRYDYLTPIRSDVLPTFTTPVSEILRER